MSFVSFFFRYIKRNTFTIDINWNLLLDIWVGGIMDKEETVYITELLSKVENLINLYMENGLEKDNALTKIAEAVFWVTYGEEENE